MEKEMGSPELSKNRVEALSDGIFAIAMTLLILEFKLPELPHNASSLQVWPAMLRLWLKFATYAVSFISLGIYWIGHHNMYHAIRRTDRVLLWLNILFFMFVSFLPFSTSILNAFRQSQVAPVFFGTNIIAIGWVLFFQWAYAGSQPGMIAEHVPSGYRKLVFSRFLTIPIILTLTVLICFWSA